MPEWQDEGIILSNKPYGELHSVASILTKKHGRHSGLVQAGQSRKRLSALQPGCFVGLEWRARLEGQLGTFKVELLKNYLLICIKNYHTSLLSKQIGG